MKQLAVGFETVVNYILNLISKARKNFRPQTDDETLLADETDYVWDPEWSHIVFLNISKDTSSALTATSSVHRV